MKKNAWLFLLILLLLSAGSLAAGDSVQEILAKAKQAAGGTAWDPISSVYTKSVIATSGLKGTVESWEDVLTGRVFASFAIGPMTGAQGFDGKVVWSQDSSKQAKADEAQASREEAANEAYRRSMAYWYPHRAEGRVELLGGQAESGRTFEVMRMTPKDGRGFEVWVDAATFLFDRIIEKAALETRTTFLSDYRPVSGVKIPFVSRTTNGEARYDTLMTVDKVELNVPLKDEMFRMPAPPPPDFALAGGASSTTIPFELINNHIYILATVNGKGPLRFLCDTGGSNIVTPELAHELGLKSEGAVQGRGVGEKSEDVGLTKVQALQVGGATLSDQVFAVYPMTGLGEVEGFKVEGLVGYEVFKRFVVKIDYERSLLTLTLPSAFNYQGQGTIVPFIYNGQIPQVEGSLDGIPGKFDIDTGGRSTLTIMSPFAAKHGLKDKLGATVEAVTGWGVGGPARGLVARAKSLKLGTAEIKDPVVEISLQSKGAFIDPYVAGNVGGGALKRFNITFDYGRQRLILEPNANYAQQDLYDRAGMWLNLAGGAFKVMDVVAGGPAAQAGLKAGDSILAIDGRTPAQLPLAEARALLRMTAPGTKVRLLVRSNGQGRELTIVLRDLVS